MYETKIGQHLLNVYGANVDEIFVLWEDSIVNINYIITTGFVGE